MHLVTMKLPHMASNGRFCLSPFIRQGMMGKRKNNGSCRRRKGRFKEESIILAPSFHTNLCESDHSNASSPGQQHL